MDENENLFSDVKFYVAECNNSEEIKNLLIEKGAKHINYLLEHVTHVVADNNCPEAEQAIEVFDIPAVNSLWVHLSLKAKKLLPTVAFSPTKNIFQNVIATFSPSLSQADVDILATTLTYYGAKVSKDFATATHFIAATADSSEVPKIDDNRPVKIVAPDWVLESVKHKTCCDERNFEASLLLPPPPPTPSPPPRPVNFTKENKPLAGHRITTTNFKGIERRKVKEMIIKLGAEYTEYLSPTNTLIICKNVGGNKYEHAIEWRTPIANCQVLTDLMLDSNRDINNMLAQAKYHLISRNNPLKTTSCSDNKELMEPWTKPISIKEEDRNNVPQINGSIKNNPPAQTSNTSEPIKVEATITTLKESEPEIECYRKSDQPVGIRKSKSSVTILILHLDSKLEEELKTYALKLGIIIASSPKSCTHLIMGKLVRSARFLCAFSSAKYVLHYKWIIESHEADQLLEEKPFILQDKEGEEQYSVCLVYSLTKMRKRTKPLFNNLVFFVTPTVLTKVPKVKEMIESAGGVVETRRLPSKGQLLRLKADNKRFVVVSCDEDSHLSELLNSNSTEVVTVEFVLSGIMRQDVDFENHRLKKSSTTFIRPETKPISQPSLPKKIRLENSSC